MSDYATFLKSKSRIVEPSGFDPTFDLHESLFPHQRDIVAWALRMGRCAVFADTGLGKTRMELEWAAHVADRADAPVLVLAPLAVAAQTVREGKTLGLDVIHARELGDFPTGGAAIVVTNYDRLDRFESVIDRLAGVVLDESSIIKHHDAKTLAQLIRLFEKTLYKLCATATPAPNDFAELGTHAEFLGVCSRQEMLAEFFVHDSGDTQTWRLKGHAEGVFWKWVASWAALIRKPSDFGYPDSGYALPALEVEKHVVDVPGLVVPESMGLVERRAMRKASMTARVQGVVDLIGREPGEPWIVWGELNAETEALAKLIPDAVEIRGSDKAEDKERRLVGFSEGLIRVLVTKPSIAGFGLNWQHCARVAFVGVSDSWESYYQAVRRCWRFGQTRPVQVHLFASAAETAVVDNLMRKEEDAKRLADELSAATRDVVRESIKRVNRYVPYTAAEPMRLPTWMKRAA